LKKRGYFISVLLCTLAAVLFPQDENIKFETVSLGQGLSQAAVNCIVQDSRGFLWFGTQDGLNRYDGYEFRIYKYRQDDPASLTNSNIRCLLQDRDEDVLWIGTYGGGLNRLDLDKETFSAYRLDPEAPSTLGHNSVFALYQDRGGVLWLGTWGGGLSRFDKQTSTFTHYRSEKANASALSQDIVRAIYEDKSGAMWIGTYGGGLNRFDRKTGRFTHYRREPGNPASLNDDRVMDIYETSAGELWIGTDGGGINVMDREKGTFQHFVHHPGDPDSLSYDRIRDIYEDSRGRLWVGTYGGGICRFEPRTRKFSTFRYTPLNPHSLTDDQVLSIYEDNGRNLWVGTYGGGVSKLDRWKWKFKHYSHIPGKAHSLSSRKIRAILEDKNGILWIGTNGGGLNRLDRQHGRYTHYRHDPENPNSPASDRVYALYHDQKEEVLWIGTFEGGLDRFDIKKETFTHYRNQPGNPNSLGSNRVRSICPDRNGDLWLGLWRGGLDRFDRVKGTFTHYRFNAGDPNSLSSDNIYCVYKDRAGVPWIGTGWNGLNRYNRQTDNFTRFRRDPGNANSLSDNDVLVVYEDRSGRLWIGTYGRGLNEYDRQRNRWTCYTVQHGLPNEVVYGILEDEQGNLWLSTNKGVSKFNPGTGNFTNYDSKDGLQSDEFTSGAYYKSRSGEMFFGGINGVSGFFPAEIKKNPYIPPVLITGFRKFNRPVEFPLSIARMKEIELSFRENFISFEFVTLNYSVPGRNRYAYKLEGFDKEWVYCGNARSASYTNLNGGTYTFKVKGSNNDGKWNEEGVSIGLVVHPPIWETWWFRILVIVSIGVMIVLLIRYRTYRIRQRNRLLEKMNARLNTEIKERKQVEKALQASEEKFRHIFENSIDIHYRADMEGKLVMVNPAGVTLMGYDDEKEMLGKDLAMSFYVDPKQREHFLNTLRKHGRVVNIEIPVKTKSGDILIVEVSSQFLYGKNGKPVGVEGICRNVSDRKKAEEENERLQQQLLHAKKMEAVGTLAGGMAHEFNNLMAVIGGQAIMLKEKINDKTLIEKQVKAIIKSSNRCTTLTNQLLSFSKKQMLKLKAVNLNDLITRMNSTIHRITGPRVEVKTFLEPDPGQIKVDAELMIQVILGIVENAVDAMPRGGTLTIITETVFFTGESEKENPDSREGTFVCLSITDTGVGMDEETMQHIFDPFFTTKKVGQGTGLDLSFVYGTVSQHNGWLKVSSSPGKGTTMKLYLPVF
jgi:PAS domain S-box-containing protein